MSTTRKAVPESERASPEVELAPPVPQKKRITIWLDTPIIDHFKALAGERGYQTLINDTLKASLERGELEAMLRRVLREELNR